MCRAISTALDEDYYVIEEKLHEIAKLFGCDELCVCCYYHLLEDVYNLKPILGYYGISIKDFKKTHKDGIYLIRVDQHLTTLIDGEIYDTWDCTDEIITNLWKVE